MKPQPLRTVIRDWSPVIGYFQRYLPQTREQKKIERALQRERAMQQRRSQR